MSLLRRKNNTQSTTENGWNGIFKKKGTFKSNSQNVLCLVTVEARWCVTCDGRRHGAAQGSDGSHGDLLAAVLDGAGMSGCNHVGFQQSAFKVYVVV